jgi:UDP-3-O-[3-hydroxymyristoyl] glucosamine N-acyltransferase
MTISAQQLAELLNGTLEGDSTITVSKPGKIEEGRAGEICFLGNAKYEEFAYTTAASIIMVDKNFKPRKPIQATLLRVENVYASLAFLLEKFGSLAQPQELAHISAHTDIDLSATIGENTAIGSFTVIEKGARIGKNCRISSHVFIGKNVVVGDDTLLHPGVKILHDCEIGARVILQAGVVIGSDGFGFAPQSDGSYKKIIHLGTVVIEDDVEIGANATVDRGSIGRTIIRCGVKLDNLVQIAHNVEIGAHTVMAAQSGVSGSTKIGKYCRIGGQAGFAGHIVVGDSVQVQAQSGVPSDTPDGAKLFGSPTIPYNDYVRAYVVFKNLPELEKRVRKIERTMPKPE